MFVGTCRVSLALGDNHSLKGKRSIVRPLITRLRREFNVSAAETGALDAWQSAEIGLAAVSSDRQYLDGLLQKVVAWIEASWLDVEVLDFEIEILHL
jgi:uncharacterized protein YlxP (DUF503 family)